MKKYYIKGSNLIIEGPEIGYPSYAGRTQEDLDVFIDVIFRLHLFCIGLDINKNEEKVIEQLKATLEDNAPNQYEYTINQLKEKGPIRSVQVDDQKLILHRKSKPTQPAFCM